MRALGNGIQNYYGSLNISAAPGTTPLTVTSAVSAAIVASTAFTGSAVNSFSNTAAGTANTVETRQINDAGFYNSYFITSSGYTGVALTNAPAGPLAGIYESSGYNFVIGTGGIARLLIAGSGAVSVLAPTSGVALSAAGLSGSAALKITGSSTSGSSYGLQNFGGTTSADFSAYFGNQSATTEFMRIYGDGGVTIGNPTGSDEGLGTLNIANGLYIAGNPVYAGLPQNALSAANYTTVLSDANKGLFQNSTGHTITFPANSSVAYPVGTLITVINGASVTTTISASDTIYWATNGATGSRTLGTVGMATMYRVNTTSWIISGSGLS